MAEVTKQVAGAVAICAAVGEAIRDLGSVPSGVLYAQLMGRMSLDQYQQVIGVLKRTGLVSEAAHVLTWTGPKVMSDFARRDQHG